jgi:hypothetical protein
MPKCDYVMCDGYDCIEEGTVHRKGKCYCKLHIITIETGVDPIYNKGEYDKQKE